MTSKNELQGIVEGEEKQVALSKDWKDRLAQYAVESKEFADNSGGLGNRFFSTRGAKLKWCGEPVGHNKLVCIVLTHCLEYAYYDTDYSPDEVSPPPCFALGVDVDDLKPHANSASPQFANCKDCPKNVYKSGKGKSKACANNIRLALLSAGMYIPDKNPELVTDASEFTSEEIGFLRIPPTSNKSYTNYVKAISAGGTPPFAVYTLIEVTGEPYLQFSFKQIKPVEDPAILEALYCRKTQAEEDIVFPYDAPDKSEVETTTKVPETKKTKY